MCYAALFGAFFFASCSSLLALFAFCVTTIINTGPQRYEVKRVLHVQEKTIESG